MMSGLTGKFEIKKKIQNLARRGGLLKKKESQIENLAEEDEKRLLFASSFAMKAKRIISEKTEELMSAARSREKRGSILSSQLSKKEDFNEKYQRHVQFNYYCQVPRYKTLADAQILLRDIQREMQEQQGRSKQKMLLKTSKMANQESSDQKMKMKGEGKRQLKIEKMTDEDERLFLRQLNMTQPLNT